MKSSYFKLLFLFITLASVGYSQTSKEYFDSGWAKFKLNDNYGAISDYNKSIELNPNSANAHSNRGLAKINIKDFKGAITDCSKAIELNPNLAEAYNNRALAKNNLKDARSAIADCDKAIEIAPNNAGAYINRGMAKIDLRDYSGAISDCNKAIELNPNLAEAYINRGTAKVGTQELNWAIEDFTKAIEINPKLAMAYYNRGLAYILLVHKESGCIDLNKAVELGFSEANKSIKQYCTNLPEKQQSGSEKVSYIEFSTRIKAKYPEYKDVDDLVLARKMVEKYPEYKDKVIFDQPVVSEGKTLYNHWLVAPPEGNLKQLFNEISAKNPQIKDRGFEAFANDMKEESNLKDLYKSLLKKYPHWASKGYDSFKKELFPEEGNKKLTKQTGNSSNFKLYNNLIETKRITIDELGDFETFNTMLSDQSKAIKLHKNLIKKGFTEDEIGNQADFLANIDQSSNTSQPTTSFQIDKIKVGDTFIDLPIPNGFVKVDDSMGILLESAKKMCPKTNTLLAFYLSKEDYANFLSNNNYTLDKYLIVQVFNDIKDKQIGSKDYRQLIKSFKTDYIEEFKQGLNEAGQKASENLSNLDEKLKMDNINIQPFGICYESKNSISKGILSKYTFTIENEGSQDYIVAAISTITKIDKKPIFLFAYKTYRTDEDLISLKALNSVWIKEVDRKQSPVSFIADIDFEDYKEAILAILTLSFIWAIYFATKKIQRKLRAKNVPKKPEFEDNKEYFDFDELLTGEKISIDPVPIVVEPEKIQEKVQITNPELLKVSRQLRFFNLLIDLVFLYSMAYFAGYVLVFFFGTLKARQLLENQYVFGSILIFIFYFIQELMFSKTLGKLITKTHVINNLGQRPTVWQLLLRSASRVIPFEVFTFLSKEKRGLHDIISKTYVIKD